MNKLRLWHRVRFRDNECDRWNYGYFVQWRNGLVCGAPETVYIVIKDETDYTTIYDICELDPDAKKFLSGDIVEHPTMDIKASYVGRRLDGSYVVEKGNGKMSTWTTCRYPREAEQPEEDRISNLEHRIESLENYVVTKKL